MSKSPAGLTAPYRWFAEALVLCRAHAGLFLFAAAALLLVVMVSAIVERVAVLALPAPALVQTLALLAIYAFFILLIQPILAGGFYRMIHAAQQGQAPDRQQLFALFKEPLAARRVVRTNLVFWLILLLLVLMPVAAIGGEPLAEWLRALSNLQPGAKVLPVMPAGTGTLLATAMLLAVLINTAKELALCQASLSERGPLSATGDGFRVALAQSASFLLFYLPIAILAFLGLLLAALVAVMLGVVLGLISPVLSNLLVIPLALLLGLSVYALAFAFFYRAWRDTLAPQDMEAAPVATPDASHHIEL